MLDCKEFVRLCLFVARLDTHGPDLYTPSLALWGGCARRWEN